jgi:hypothetical protein
MTPQFPPGREQSHARPSETPLLDGLLDWATTLPLAQKDAVVALMADLLLDLTAGSRGNPPHHDEQN